MSNKLEIIRPEQFARWNAELQYKSPLEIINWAIGRSAGQAIVSTNFRPFEAVVLHLCVQVKPDIPVLWVDHGYNRPATYRHLEHLRRLLGLNLKAYLPAMTPAHYEAVYGPIPGVADEPALKRFSTVMKLEPFQRAMHELGPTFWITGLRRVQNPQRSRLSIVCEDANFGTVKVNPVFEWSDAQMQDYLRRHGLPNEWDYFDPAKADEKRECGLHASWTHQELAHAKA